MDSFKTLLERLKPSSKDFSSRLINITAIYHDTFDSDSVLQYLKEGTLFEDNNSDWVVKIPPIYWSVKKKEYIIPVNVILHPDIPIPIPETIEEFRVMAKTHGISVRLNTKTWDKIFNG